MNQAPKTRATRLARKFHYWYEKLAPKHHYRTRNDTREFDPQSHNGQLMIDVCERVIEDEILPLQRENAELRRDKERLVEALDTVTSVMGLTPILGNKQAFQDAYDIGRAATEKEADGE